MEKKHDKSIIRNYTEVDLPLYSYDRIFAMGNDTLIVELYDTLAGAYLSDDATPVSDVTVKQEKASYYVNGLLEKGGPSTDVFKKALGEEKTAKLFGDILFGTKIE